MKAPGAGILTGRRAAFWLLLAVGLSGVVMLVQAFHRAYRSIGYDFTARMEQCRAFFEGVDPYAVATRFPLTYPLFHCVALAPLAHMPYWLANLLWFAVNWACAWFSAWYILRSVGPHLSRDQLVAVAALVFVLSFEIIQNNFLNGQTNFVLLALCVLAFKFLQERRPVASGLALAAGVALKVTPLILLPYLLVRRAWKAAAWALIGILGFVFLLPWMLRGGAVWAYHHGYLFNYLAPQILHGGNSVPLSSTFALSPFVHAALPALEGSVVSFTIAVLVLVPPAILTVKTPPEATVRQTMLFAAFLTAIPWMTPISETHHLAFLLPGAGILTYRYLLRPGLRPASRVLALLALYLPLWLGLYAFAAYAIAIGVNYGLVCFAALREPETAPEQPAAMPA